PFPMQKKIISIMFYFCVFLLFLHFLENLLPICTHQSDIGYHHTSLQIEILMILIKYSLTVKEFRILKPPKKSLTPLQVFIIQKNSFLIQIPDELEGGCYQFVNKRGWSQKHFVIPCKNIHELDSYHNKNTFSPNVD